MPTAHGRADQIRRRLDPTVVSRSMLPEPISGVAKKTSFSVVATNVVAQYATVMAGAGNRKLRSIGEFL